MLGNSQSESEKSSKIYSIIQEEFPKVWNGLDMDFSQQLPLIQKNQSQAQTEKKEQNQSQKKSYDDQPTPEEQEQNRINSILDFETTKTDSSYMKEYIEHLYPQKQIVSPRSSFSQANDLQNNIPMIHRQQIKLLATHFFHKCQTYSEQILIHCFQSTKNSEIVTVQFQLGFYKTSATILNLSSAENQKSPFHNCAINKFGGFGNIYLVQNQNQEIAIKCIESKKPFSHEDSTDEKEKFFVSCLQEWFFLKLFSALEIGPKIKKILGFDLIFGSTCVEFAMEVCSPLSHSIENEKNLKKALKKMHALRIMHRDIKPGNMMWSDEFKRPVFIDFGGTKFIRQNLGYKTYTSFMGTTGYTSKEMAILMHSNNDFVDLYYNDFYGLRNSVAVMAQQREDKPEKCEKINFMQNFDLLLTIIKSKMYTKNFLEIHDYLQQFNTVCWDDLEKVQEQIAQFLVQLKPSVQLKQVYLWLSEQIRAKEKFRELKYTYHDQLQMVCWTWVRYNCRTKSLKNEKNFYEKLYINYGKISSIEKKISMIFFSKQNIVNYINYTNKQADAFTIKQKLIIYCIVSLASCTLAHNCFDFTIDQKFAIANQFVKKITLQAKDKKFPQLIFNCPLKQFSDIAYLLQYFLVNIWQHLPKCYQNSCEIWLISSLALAGFPFYVKQANDFAFYFFLRNWSCENQIKIKSNVVKRMQGILLFWLCTSLIKVHNKLFFNKGDSNFILDKQQISDILKQSNDIRMNLMASEGQYQSKDEQLFIQRNHLIYEYYNQECAGLPPRLSISDLKTLLDIVPAQKKYYNLFAQFKIYVQLALNNLDIESQRQILAPKRFQEQLPIQGPVIDRNLHFSLLIDYLIKAGNLDRLVTILSIVDSTIIISAISQRVFIDLRIYFAWINYDIKKMKGLVTIIVDNLVEYSIQNFKLISSCLDTIQCILKWEKFQFWQRPIPKLIMFYYLQKIINKNQQFIQASLGYHSDIIYENNFFLLNNIAPLKNLPNDQIPLKVHDKQPSNLLTVIQVKLISKYTQTINYILRFVYIHEQIYTHSRARSYNLFKNVTKLKENEYKSNDLITYLRSQLPEKLRKMIFLSEQTFNQIQEFSISVVEHLQIILKFYHKQYNDKKASEKPQNHDSKLQPVETPMQCSESLNQNRLLLQTIHNQILKLQFRDESFFKNVASLFESHSVEQLIKNQRNQIQIIMMVIFSYYPAKIKLNQGTNINDFQQIIDLFNHCNTQQHAFKYLFHFDAIQLIFEAFLVCEKSHEQIFCFLLRATSVLSKFCEKSAIHQFQDALRIKFTHHLTMFQRKPNCWKPLQFISYMHQQRKRIKPIQNPYIGMVLIAALRNIHIDTEIRRSLFQLAVISMASMKIKIQTYISFLFYQAFLLLPQQKRTLTSTIQLKKGNRFQKLKFTDDMVRRQYYFASKAFRYLLKCFSQNFVINETFKIIQKKKSHLHLPKHIEKLVRKKLQSLYMNLDNFIESNFLFQQYQQHIDNI